MISKPDLLRRNRDIAIAACVTLDELLVVEGSRPTSPCKRIMDENFQHGGTNIHCLHRSWVCKDL